MLLTVTKMPGRLRVQRWLALIFLVVSCCQPICLLGCQALSSSTSISTHPTTTLSSIGKSQLAVIDGGEWNSVQSILRDEQKQTSVDGTSTTIPATKYGYMQVVSGRDDQNRRVVAMQCLDNDDENDDDDDKQINVVYADTVAEVPDKVSDDDAIATFITALSTVHCALPKLDNVGGGDDSVAMGKAVVLGCSEVACFAAEGLASLGIDVFLVNNKGTAKVNNRRIQVIKPAMGTSENGFASHVGQFDALVDTIGNERSSSLTLNDPVDGEDFYDIGISFGSSVLQLLKSQHGCQKYISTLTHSQEVVANEGIFGGPGKAEEHSQKVGSLSFLKSSRECHSVLPPKSLGKTIESLFNSGIIFPGKQRRKLCSKKSDAVRGWNLGDFWESTSWPRDSVSGTGTVRYGFPVRDGPSLEEGEVEFMISESPYRPDQARGVSLDDGYDEIGDFGLKEARKSKNPQNRAVQNNPYVLNVLGVEGFQSEIVDPKMDCIVFMSAKFCKTCRTINPIFTRMARLNQENDSTKVSFVKAEASGESGKALGRHLSVQAVPSFVLFREGQQFGVPLSVSKLPSRKIDRALELLARGAPWNDKILNEDDGSSS